MSEVKLKNFNVEAAIRQLYGTDAWREGVRLEFKSAKQGIPKDFWPTYSAFANTDGGLIVLGVDDEGNLENLNDISKKRKDLTNLLNNPNKCSVNLCIVDEMVKEFTLSGKKVLAVFIPKATPKDMPVYVNGNMENCFFRQNESDVKCTQRMKEQMIRDKAEGSQDSCIFPETGVEDLDADSLRQYRNRMRSFKPDHPWLSESDIGLLKKLGGYRCDKIQKVEGLTIAGILMFGSSDLIRDCLPKVQLNYYENLSETGSDLRWTHRISDDGTWTSNLYQFFFKVLPLIYDGIKTPFVLNPDMTRRGESGAHIAVREAFANALIHADYKGEGGIFIRRTTKGLVFSNPGTLLIPMERMLQGGISVCRNISLQTMFQMMGVVEKAGSGIDKIFTGWVEKWLSVPKVSVELDPARVTWTLPYVGVIDEHWQNKVREFIGYAKYDALSTKEKMVLLFIPETEYRSHAEIRKVLNIHPSDLSRILSKFVVEGFLKTEGRARGMKYCLAIQQRNDESSDTRGNEKLLEDTELSENEKMHLPESVQNVMNRKRAGQVQMEQAIKDLCANSWIGIGRICSILGRDRRTMQKILKTMVLHKLLHAKFPDAPNHPQQAYRTNPQPPEQA